MLALFLAFSMLQDPSVDFAYSWPIGFTVVHTEELPKGDWISYWTQKAIFEVSGDSQELEVSFDANDGYVGVDVHLWLRPEGARVTASKGDCTYFWSGDHVAGTCALVTDGNAAVLQFEIYEGGGDLHEHVHGQVELTPAALELAKSFRTPGGAASLQLVRQEFTPEETLWRKGPQATYVATGSIDAFGRRQGLWSVRERGASEALLEQSWKDGVPHGLYRERRGGVDRFGHFEQGFVEGEWWTGYPDGTRHVSEYLHGGLVRTTNYAADGSSRGPSAAPSFPDSSDYWRRILAFHTRAATR